MSPTIGKLAAALSKAQAEMKPAARGAYNTFFKSSYAPLEAVIDVIKEPFKNHELAYSQPTRTDEHGNVHVTTIIMHSSGEWISGESTAKPAKPDAQGIGAVISYLRRYGLESMAGVSRGDDDAESASDHDPKKQAEAGNRANVQVEFKNAVAAFKTLGKSENDLLVYLKVSNSTGLTHEHMDQLRQHYDSLTRDK